VLFVDPDFRIHPPSVWTHTFCVALLNTHARIADVPMMPKATSAEAEYLP
jgi:hypothetical protein